MKIVIYILLVETIFTCCSSNLIETHNEMLQASKDIDITYPLANITKSVDSLSLSWERLEYVTLPSGEIVHTPWNQHYSKSTIPTEYREDIKIANGWELIAHTLNSIEKGLNYLFFYNKNTGILKVFYYLEHCFSQTTGLWHVHIDKPQNLLAFTNSFAKALDHPEKTQDTYCSNITTNQDKAFALGWNCFELEIAYDPYFETGFMTIEPCGIISSELHYSGKYDSKSNGTIISLNNEKKGKLKGSGKDAEKYISENFPNSIGINTYSILDSAFIKNILKKGIHKLFNSFFAKTSKEPQGYNLSFTTNGSITLNGNINTYLGGGFSPITIDISNQRVGKLGVWNLLTQPKILFNTLGKHIYTSDFSFPIFRIYGASIYDYCAIINPRVYEYLSFDYEIFTGSHDDCQAPKGELSGKMNYSGQGELIYDDLYKQKAVEFKVYFPGIDNHDPQQIPPCIFLYESKSETNDFGIENNYIFKVYSRLINKDLEIISTKSFIPLLEWRKDNLETNKKIASDTKLGFILQ